MDLDSNLVKKAKSGNGRAFGLLVKKYRDPILRLAFDYVGNYEDAKDIAQNVFIRASNKLPTFEGRSSFASWLYRIAINACLDANRLAGRQAVCIPETAAGEDGLDGQPDTSRSNDPEFLVESAELNRQLHSALETLPDKQQTIVRLRYFQGLSTREIAEVVECDINTVRTHLFRAFSQLRKRLYQLKME
jgi:RNA polymerase sigma-70 factor (ECF subfamily)